MKVIEPSPTALLPKLVVALRPHLLPALFGLLMGGILGYVIYAITPTVYQAKGAFLINQLPFGLQDAAANDPETSRQLVQSLILSVSSEGMKHEVAQLVGVADTDLAFAGHDRSISLSSHDKAQANIEIIATRNSRLGTVTAEASDRTFAAQVVDAVFTKMKVLNQVAGRLDQIEFRLKLNRSEATNLVQEQGTVMADRIKFETQAQSLQSYLDGKHSLVDFPAFATDATLSNLKTQLILVSSDYASLAAQSVGGTRLQGKRGELQNLREQLSEHTEGLARGLRASLQIAQTREASLRTNLAALEQSSATLEKLRTTLAKGFGDFNLHDDLTSDGSLVGEASVVVIVDPAYAVPRPVRPTLSINLALGLMLGLGLGFGLSYIRSQFRGR